MAWRAHRHAIGQDTLSPPVQVRVRRLQLYCDRAQTLSVLGKTNAA